MSWMFGKAQKVYGDVDNYIAGLKSETEENNKKFEKMVVQTLSDGRLQYVNAKLKNVLEYSQLLEDVDEVISCLNDSPRFKRHLCRVAEEKLESKRKELAEAEAYAQKVCRV